MRFICLSGLAMALLVLPVAAQERSNSRPPSCSAIAKADRLERLTPEGDLVLESGGLARLAALRLPTAPAHREAALAQLKAWIGQPVFVATEVERDRWNRSSVRIRSADDESARDMARILLEKGLALVDPGIDGVLCQPELLTFENIARERNLGLWAEGAYNPIDAEQISRLQDRFGTFTLVEGRVRSVGERTQRIYLNFGGHWAEDFTIIIPKRIWKLMEARGINAAALKGRRIRARGILEPWQGAALTIVVPEMIERLEGTRLPR